MEEKSQGFTVKIEDVAKIFEIASKQSNETIGRASLSPPLKNVVVGVISSGKEFSLVAYVNFDVFRDKEDKKYYYYQIKLPLAALSEMPGARFFNYDSARIFQNNKDGEPAFVAEARSTRIIISAGKTDAESPPAIKVTNVNDLRDKLELLALTVRTMVKGIYADFSGKGKKFYEPDVTFHLRGHLLPDEDDPEVTRGDKRAAELKAAIHRIDPSSIEESLADVSGVDEAKEEVMQVVDFLKDPGKYFKMGAKVPRGVLFVGLPGTGKTMLAKAIAKEANIPFFYASGSEFVQTYVGEGAGRIRALFNEVRKEGSPCIIFIDELDALAKQREGGSGGDSEYNQTLSQLLNEMDGFERNKNIVLIAATNLPELLDPAVLRPGRFGKRITLDLPDVTGREAILKVHVKNKPLADDVDLKKIALGTPGFSGSELAGTLNEAALLAVARNKVRIDAQDIADARDRVRWGASRKIRTVPAETLKTAHHEIGHAIVQTVLYPDTDPLEFVTLLPRGETLGMMTSLPEEDLRARYKHRLEAELAVFMAGRIAEEMFLGKEKITDGARADLRYASEIAAKMVKEWGMSKLGPISFGSSAKWKFLGGTNVRSFDCGEKTKNKIDKEIARITETAYKRAKKILKKHKKELYELAQALLKRETMTGEEVRKYLKRPLPTDSNP